MVHKSLILIFVFGIFTLTWNVGHGQPKPGSKKKDFKKTIIVSAEFVDADIETYLNFQGPYKLLVARIGLEQNLGLTKSKVFFSGNVLWRITKRSSVFFSYYWIHRQKTYVVQKEIPYLEDYIPKGSQVDVFFNTNVLDVGYMLTFLEEKRAFLGGYLNIYVINLKTGISTNGVSINEKLNYFVPVPNLGLFSSFEVAPWLELRGNMGLFYLRFQGYTERVNDLQLVANFRPTPWLGLHIGYKVFEIYLLKEIRGINAAAEYHFQGPVAGVTLKF